MRKDKGFTLIELVVLIVILGVLSVTALPKFINLSQDAHDAIAKNIFASFTTSVSLYHSCWLASGKLAAEVNLKCFGNGDVDSTPEGYPLGVLVTLKPDMMNGDYCGQLWHGLLDADEFQIALHTDASFGGDNDIIYWYSGGPSIYLANSYCYYNYISDNPAKGQENWQLQYYPGTGETKVRRSTLG